MVAVRAESTWAVMWPRRSARAVALLCAGLAFAQGRDAQAQPAAADAAPATASPGAVTPEMRPWFDLIQQMIAVREAPAPDEFTPTKGQPSMVGQHFRILMPLARNQADDPWGQSANWRYDADKQVLSLRVEVAAFNAAEFSPAPSAGPLDTDYGFYVGYHAFGTAASEAQNGFGARFKVNHTDVHAYAIVFPGGSRGWLPASRSSLALDVPVSPEVAKNAVSSLELAIDGTFQPFQGAHVITCGKHYIEATFQSPMAISEQTCIATAVIDDVEIVGVRGPAATVVARWGPDVR